ncbi:hypothetical protein JST97_27735 [bacterium]|nr:hypothetical protein [bacterium]
MFEHYLAFGDSMSIDEYAGPNLGAASLLYRNCDEHWPEFTGLDLVSQNPRCGFTRLACNGATLSDLWRQLTQAPKLSGAVLVTVTVGANDVLAGLGGAEERPAYACGQFFGGEPVGSLLDWQQSLRRWLDALEDHTGEATVILGNLYDPTDGSGFLQNGSSLGDRYRMLEAINDLIRRVAAQRGMPLADFHGHFLGKAAQLIDRNVEPTRLGSSEIRRVFWDAAQTGRGSERRSMI